MLNHFHVIEDNEKLDHWIGKVKEKLVLCLTNKAQCHEDVLV
jgi:hypothetical protein